MPMPSQEHRGPHLWQYRRDNNANATGVIMKAIVLRQHGAIDSLEFVADFPDPDSRQATS
jgi:hypothetical protein